MTKRLSRRDFLGLAGMTTVAGGLTCVGGLLGYLTVRQLSRAASPVSTPTPVPTAAQTRPTTLKQIERPPIITRAGWGAREPDHAATNESGFYSLDNPEGWRVYEDDLRDVYRTIVVHHSAEYEADDPATMRYIQDMHMDRRRWADLGYHFGVGRSGEVFEGRDLAVRGTHTQGVNTGSVGVVFLGHLDRYAPTSEQLDAGRRLIDWLALRLGLTHLAGHYQFNDFTECPGEHMYPHLPLLAASAGLIFGTGGYDPPPEE